MAKAQTNKPLGSRFNRIVGAWLRANGFDGLSNQERYRAILCVENRDAIEAWRSGLDDAKRRKLNHPGAIWSHWSKATGMGKSPRGRPPTKTRGVSITIGRVARKGRTISWPQEMIRKAALAMRESRSTDYFVMAKIGLEHAIRSEADVALLLSRPKAAETAVFARPQTFPMINLPVT